MKLLSGNVWPVHFGRLPDEALTSWITRLALAHVQVPSTFFKHTVPEHMDSWKQDLDVTCPDYVLEQLKIKCCQTKRSIYSGTLDSIRHKFEPNVNHSTALPRWVSPSQIRRNTVHHRGWKVCSLCLIESPYLRLHWRFMFYVVCPEHHVHMIDQCHECGSFITSHKIHKGLHDELPEDALAYCHHCGHDHRNTPLSVAIKREVSVVNSCLTILKKGYFTKGRLELHYSHLYFQGLRLIMRGLLQGKQENLLKYILEKELLQTKVLFYKHDELEFLSADTLRSLLIAARWLMFDWPTRFLKMSRMHGLGYNNWIRPRDVSPYWFSSILGQHLRSGNITSPNAHHHRKKVVKKVN